MADCINLDATIDSDATMDIGLDSSDDWPQVTSCVGMLQRSIVQSSPSSTVIAHSSTLSFWLASLLKIVVILKGMSEAIWSSAS